VATKKLTFSADERTIERARAHALELRTTLDQAFGEWLEQYAAKKYPTADEFDRIMKRLDHVHARRLRGVN